MTRSSQTTASPPRQRTPECPAWCDGKYHRPGLSPGQHETTLVNVPDLAAYVSTDDWGNDLKVQILDIASEFELTLGSADRLHAMGLALTEAAQRLRIIVQMEAAR